MNGRNTITINGADYELSEEFLSDVLETAVEGGCSYWADVSAEPAGDDTGNIGVRDFDLSDYVDDDPGSNDGGRVSYTAASFLVSKDPTQGGTLDLQGIADAIGRIAGGEVEVPPAIREIILAAVENDDASDIDAEAADCIVQIGLFDEIVYG
ncbi:MAG TPA: hypothetical protein VEC01_08505 [Noviherbaspirillum sp.]|uniref:hypothetical protein n=1 Tax=Noviherbaspirillum sp. TaxID=1926288 RepID=UPI002D229F6C|nr:hypothetical protein [Noviherbaspirillum sp.]HYD95353.1 hypothetical protein [Noviherbaspirillum sp.]